MAKIHINSDTGEVGQCKSTKGKCPFGGEDEHFTSEQAARAHFESKQETFETGATDLTALPAKWRNTLSPESAVAIAKKLKTAEAFIKKVESGAIETTYADITAFLSSPAYAQRPRGQSFEIDPADPNKLVIGLYSRQGGGNRECYCDASDDDHQDDCLNLNNGVLEAHPDFIYYEDDDFDSTYTTHYFRPPGGLDDSARTKHYEQSQLLGKYNKLKELQKKIQTGELPPWAINAVDPPRYSRSDEATEKNAKAIAEAKKLQDSLTLAKDSIKTGKKLSAATVDNLKNVLELYPYERLKIANDLEALARQREAYSKLEKTKAIASALPDGELKDYLLGARPTESYRTTVGKGRAAKNVIKKYTPKAPLVSDLDDAKRSKESAESSIKYLYQAIDKAKDKAKDSSQTAEAAQKSFEKARERAWRAGWPGLVKDIPAIPDSF